jgi:heterodisulfide reductase subunit B
MKQYSFFPGCTFDVSGVGYKLSTEAVIKALDVELKELEDWNCCGSTPYSSTNELASFCVAARNLALAEARDSELVTPCSSCYVVLNRANTFMKDYPELREKVDQALAAGNLKYNRSVKVRHLLDIFVNDIGFDAIKVRVTKKLEGLKVAPYYGCQLVRPELGFDDPEYPQSLDKLIEALDAKVADFPLKSRCCGGSLIISEERRAVALAKNLLDSASAGGADCIITVCAMCQTNLDLYQSVVNKRFKTNFNIPILYFTQLMGMAFGLDTRTLGLDTCIVSPDRLLAPRPAAAEARS